MNIAHLPSRFGVLDLSPKLQAAARWIAGLRAEPVIGRRYAPTRWLCAEHDRQLGGESPLSSLMVAKD